MTITIVPNMTPDSDPLVGWQDAGRHIEDCMRDLEAGAKKARKVPHGSPALIRDFDAMLDKLKDMRDECLDTYWDRCKDRDREARG